MTNPQPRLRQAFAARYTIQREIGRGGAATVHLAQDRKHDRLVAIKVMRPELAATLGAERFLREIDIAAKLTHPHILPLYDSGEAEGYLYYVMPYVTGESLRERITRERRLPLDEAVHIALEVAGALEYAHECGVVHRDVKPENILLQAGHALVTDFGIARAIAAAGEERVTLPGVAIGTPAYMSPEQADGEHAVDARSDIYALGCVLYEMLAGEPPYGGETAQAILARKAAQPVPAVRALRHSIPVTLEHAIRRAMALEPSERFATSQEFSRAIAAGRLGSARTSGIGLAVTPGPPRTSIAVLPFANMSAEAENEYFSDGIAEEITNALTKVRALQVAARTSAFAYKGRDLDIRRIGEELGVAAVLEGSVRKAGTRLRITAQLVKTADGYHLWSERYDRDAEDVFAIQDEIAQSIVEALEVILSEEEKGAMIEPPTDHLEAYEAYLRGRFFLHRFQKHSVHHAREMFARAIDVDPDFALAHAGVADCSSFLYMYFDGSVANLEEAERASRRALELDPDLAEAHAARGLAVALDRRYDEAEAEFERAIGLNPAIFEPYYFYARTCFQQGKLDRAVELFEQACAIREDYQARLLAALALQGLNRDADAQAAYRKALEVTRRHLELNPGDGRALTLGAGCLARLGRDEEAVAWCDRALELDPDDAVVVYAVACVDAIVGRTDAALDLLERAVAAGFGNLKWIENDPDFASLRGHPRFQAVVSRG